MYICTVIINMNVYNNKKIKIMATKKMLENNLSKIAGINVEITFARTNMITIAWDNKDDKVFNRLQTYFKGKLFGYEYDEECDMSVCCLNI